VELDVGLRPVVQGVAREVRRDLQVEVGVPASPLTRISGSP
jgi:hypothetical protein